MATTKDQGADWKKVSFPPPKAWDPEAKWTKECVMFQECGEKHSPERCEVFKKLPTQQRLKRIAEQELYRLCYRHLQGKECWSLGRVPNYGVAGAWLLTIPHCKRQL
jgi:inorganic pyrophosphatase